MKHFLLSYRSIDPGHQEHFMAFHRPQSSKHRIDLDDHKLWFYRLTEKKKSAPALRLALEKNLSDWQKESLLKITKV